MMIFQIRVTRKNNEQDFSEIETCDKMAVATYIITEIRNIDYQKNDPTIEEVRYNEKDTEEYRYA